VIVDLVGGPCVATHWRAAALRGRTVCVGRMGGARAELDLDLLATRRLTLTGVTFRTRTVDAIAAVGAAIQRDVLPHLASGQLHWPIDRAFPLASVAQAHDARRANAHVGKLVLVPG
jgi:NADPH:quinone reductase